MEDIGIKKNMFADAGATPRDKSTSLAELATSFQNLVSQSGNQLDAKLGTMMDQSSLGSLLQSSAGAEYRRDSTSHKNDQGQDVQTKRNDDDRDWGKPDGSRAEQSDSARPERTETHSESSSQGPDQRSQSSSTDNGGAQNADARSESHNDGENTAASTDKSSSSDDGDTSTNADVNNGAGQNAQNKDQNETVGGVNAVNAAPQQASNVNLELAALLAGGQSAAEPGKTSGAAKIGGNDVIIDAKTSGAQQGSTQSKTGAQSHTLGQTAPAAEQHAKSSEDVVKIATAAQQQGNALSKMIGGTQKTQINVSVAGDGDTLTSKPAASLVAGTVLASAASNGTSQNGAQGASHSAAPSQNTAQTAAAAQAQSIQQQNQAQQAATQNAQLQAGNQNAGKGTTAGLQASQGATAAGGAAGGETTAAQTTAAPSTNSAQQSSQAQQNQAAQANQGPKAATTGQPIVDQISVKINKAIQAGTDRISVQLRPSELGRVDVKLDVGNDGRVLAIVTADNKDTLELLKRDSGDLQRALEDAGMQLDSGDLSFNLRGEEREFAGQNEGSGTTSIDTAEDDEIPEAAMIADMESDVSDGRIDVKA